MPTDNIFAAVPHDDFFAKRYAQADQLFDAMVLQLQCESLTAAAVLGDCSWIKTGSRHMGGEQVNSDFDIAIHYTDDLKTLEAALKSEGFNVCSDRNYGRVNSSEYVIMRKGLINLIIMDNESTFNAWKQATDIGRAIGMAGNPLYKTQRATLFEHLKASA